jgi:hypothetical protein
VPRRPAPSLPYPAAVRRQNHYRPTAYPCIPRGLAPAFSSPSGSRATALTLPSDHGGRTTTSCPRRRQLVDRLRALLDLDLVEVDVARIERARHVVGVEVRGVDRLLEVAAEVEMAEQRVELPLVLHVAAGRADRHVGLAVAEHQSRRQRRARALPRLERVGQPLGEPEHLRARAHAEAEAGHDRRAVEPAAARGGRRRGCRRGRRRRGGRCRPPGRRSAPSRPPPRPRAPAAAGSDRGRPARRAAARATPARRPARAAAPRTPRSAAPPSARRRSPGRRTRPRGPRRPASRTRARCARTRPGPSRRGRSPRAARAAGASPGPAPTGRSCRSCARGSRA